MIEKQLTSIKPPAASKEFASSLVDSLALRHDLSDKNTAKQVMKQWPNYADEVWRRHELEQERLDAERAARDERLARPLYSEALHRKVVLGATVLVLVGGSISAGINWFHENDQTSITYDSDTELTSKDEPVVNEYINPPSDLSRYDPRPPESEYINPPSDISPKYPQNPPGYENENPSKNDESDGVVVPDVPPMNPEPNDYDNPPSEPNW